MIKNRILWLTLALATPILPVPAAAVTWTRVEEIPADDVFSIHHFGTTLYAGAANIVYIGANDGESWTPTAVVDAAVPAIETVVPAGGALWTGTFGQGVFRSTNTGTSWQPVNTGLTGLGASQVLELVEKGGDLFAATAGAGVFTLDLGTPTQWSGFNAGIPLSIAGNVGTLVESLGASKIPVGQQSVASTLVATAGANGFVYRFPDEATEWQEVAIVPPISPGLLPTDLIAMGNDLFIGAPNRVFRSEDDALTWTFKGSGIVQNTETFLATDGTALFAGVDFQGNNHRIYSSTNRGDSWQPIDEIPGVFLYAIATAGGKLFAARTDGLWWTPAVTAAVEETTWGSLKSRFGK